VSAEQRPRPTRIRVEFKGTVTTSDAHSFPVTVRDLSAQGFRLELADGEELLVGEEVTLSVPGQASTRGTIRWAAGREAGGSFSGATSAP